MAANVDSPKRRSLRLQRKSGDNVTPDTRSLERAPSRTSGPRTRLSGGKRNDVESGGSNSVNRPQRRSKGQKAEEPGHNSKGGGKAELTGGATEDTTQNSAAPSVRTRRSREGPQDGGKPSRPEPKNSGGLTPSMVTEERNGAGEARGSQRSKGQESIQKIDNVAREVRASSSTNRTKNMEKAKPCDGRTRSDAEESGASGVHSSENAASSRHSTTRDNEKDVSSPSRRRVCDAKSPVRSAAQGPSDAASSSAPPTDSRVHCTSKQLLQEVLGMCAEFSKEIMESQNYLNPEQRQLQQKNFTWNFETTFQDNVSINGQSWHEAPDTAAEPDIKILEDQLDDAIVETAMKRKRHPRKILGHFVKGLKVEREMLDLYKPVVKPKELRLDSRCESRMVEQAASTASISQQIKETMKALPAQLEKAEGFSQVLSLQPALQGSRIRQDIFSSQVVLQDMVKTVPKELETTPSENELAVNIAPERNTRRRQNPSAHSNLYPLRSKRKISLEG
ncbi:kinetochore-associated protein NSL1 homolog [Leptodactylus fuscus]|uniref:kinetochore-associated protein NSL1 homolog n=1 Tax=Leptodactylus fuscus TaxID=238119 RepID=UPI003F4F0710